MVDLFGTSSVIEEARLSARQRSKEGKKPGSAWWVSILAALGIFLMSQFLMCIPLGGMMLYQSLSKASGVDDDLTFSLSMDPTLIIAMLWLEIIMILVTVFYTKVIEKRKLFTIGFSSKKAVPNYIAGLIMGAAFFSVAVLICKLTGVISLDMHNKKDITTMLLFFGGWIIQGLAEEVHCRGFLLTSLSRRYSVTASVLISSAVFSILHIGNIFITPIGFLAFLNIFLFGVLVSVLFIKTGNIWLCAALHSSWNLVQGNVYGIPVSGVKDIPSFMTVIAQNGHDLIHGGDFGIEGGIAATIVLTAVISLVLIVSRRRTKLTSA